MKGFLDENYQLRIFLPQWGETDFAPTRDIFAAVLLHVFLQIVINTLACNQKRTRIHYIGGLQGEKFICKKNGWDHISVCVQN